MTTALDRTQFDWFVPSFGGTIDAEVTTELPVVVLSTMLDDDEMPADDNELTLVLGEALPAETPSRPRIVAIIAARNEEESIALSVKALYEQTVPPDEILVVVNNTTDDTELEALSAGAKTLVMDSNPHAKAGALNTGLKHVLPGLSPDDLIFVQDADTQPVPYFFERALQCMDEHPGCIVSGRYACRAEFGFIGMMQRNEFTREGMRINRRLDRTHIVVGTSCLIPVRALLHIHDERKAGRLPGKGFVYAVTSRTEDYELTLALHTLGYLTMSPVECDAVTDVMDTVKKLWQQRIRWWRGGFEDIATYGWTKVTRGFIARQLAMLMGIVAFLLYVVAVFWTLAAGGSIAFELIWLPITGIFILDRITEVHKAGKLAMLVSGLLLPEMIYDVFLHVTYLAAAWKGIRTAIAAHRGVDVALNSTSAWKET